MTEEAKRKSVYDIIFAMKESNVIESCVLGFPQCSDENPCSLHYEYKELKIRLISLFKGKTIYDLAKTSKKLIPVNEQRN